MHQNVTYTKCYRLAQAKLLRPYLGRRRGAAAAGILSELGNSVFYGFELTFHSRHSLFILHEQAEVAGRRDVEAGNKQVRCGVSLRDCVWMVKEEVVPASSVPCPRC